MITALLAYTPFLEPMDLHREWWLLLIPMAVLTSIAWKAVRVVTFRRFWWPVLLMSTQIVVAMALLAVGAYALVELLVPMLG